ncbi:MAG: GPW/gp25 family protein [Peptococcaceae bacterium]|nr:GPW/gp25 family protein [Peptococcaceae bacterium]
MSNPKLGVDLAGPDLIPTYQGDVALIEGKNNVRGAILRRLNTPLGCLFAHPWYGNPVHDILSENMNDAWAGRAIAGIRQCLDQEPRIKVESVQVTMYPEDRLAVFNITYRVLDEPGEENIVWQVSIT